MTPSSRLKMSALALAALVVAGAALSTSAAPRERRVAMTILSGGQVLDDGKATYVDFSLTTLDEDICVNGLGSADRSVFMRLNRRQDWPDGRLDLWCHERPEGSEVKYQDRTYKLLVDSTKACSELGDTDVPCTVVPDQINQPHVQAATVFKSKAKSSTVSWQFSKGGRHYQVNTTGAVPMTGTEAKILTWSGSAYLVEVGGEPIDTFLLPFRGMFERF